MTYPQVELGAFATSAIPTAGSPVSRGADSVQPISTAATCLGGSQGGLILKTNDGQAAATATLMSANGTVMLGETSANKLNTAIGTSLTSSNTATWTGANDSGLGWSSTAGVVDLNGTTTTDANSRSPSANFYLGSTGGSSAFWDGHFKSLACYNTYQSAPN
jgi:hypothetical protein